MSDDRKHETSLEKAIRENAETPQSIQTRDGSATAHPLEAQIKAADREAAIRARRRGGVGFPVFPIVSGGPR